MLTLALTFALAQSDAPYLKPPLSLTPLEAWEELEVMRDRWPSLGPPILVLSLGSATALTALLVAAMAGPACSVSGPNGTACPVDGWQYVAVVGAVTGVAGIVFLLMRIVPRIADQPRRAALERAAAATPVSPELRAIGADALRCSSDEVAFTRDGDVLIASGCGRDVTCEPAQARCVER